MRLSEHKHRRERTRVRFERVLRKNKYFDVSHFTFLSSSRMRPDYFVHDRLPPPANAFVSVNVCVFAYTFSCSAPCISCRSLLINSITSVNESIYRRVLCLCISSFRPHSIEMLKNKIRKWLDCAESQRTCLPADARDENVSVRIVLFLQFTNFSTALVRPPYNQIKYTWHYRCEKTDKRPLHRSPRSPQSIMCRS